MAAIPLSPIVDDPRHFRSVPPSPYLHPHSHSHPRDPRSLDLEALRGAELGLQCGYLGPAPYPLGGPRSMSPYPPGAYEFSDYPRNADHMDVEDRIRATNLAVQVANAQLSHVQRYAQIQPKMCADGRFPADFRWAKTLEDFKLLDPSQLDRILHAYNLPTDLRSLRLSTRDPMNTKTAHKAKLVTLYDFLGAGRLSEYERDKMNFIYS